MTDITTSMAVAMPDKAEVENNHDSEEVTPENIPLPTTTNSMITVRLSDVQSLVDSAEERITEDSHSSDSSIDSRPCSRSSTRSSQDSSTSTSVVDWEGLERSEQQEPRDDATDEVGYKKSNMNTHAKLR